MRFLPGTLSLLLACTSLLTGDESTFDSAPLAPWTQYDPLYKGTFDFSADRARLSSQPLSLKEFEELRTIYGEAAAAPRVVMFAPTGFADTVVSVDLVAWKITTNHFVDGQYHALFTRIQPGIAPGAIFAGRLAGSATRQAEIRFSPLG